MNRNEFKLTSIFWLSFFFSGFGFLATSTMMAIQQRANPSRFFRSNREFVCLFMFWALAMAIKKISMSSKVVLVFLFVTKRKTTFFWSEWNKWDRYLQMLSSIGKKICPFYDPSVFFSVSVSPFPFHSIYSPKAQMKYFFLFLLEQ